ncbi:DUF6708 domain-containing protein [Luteimonas sp. A501]
MSEDRDDGMLVPEWKQPEPELEFSQKQRKTNLYAKKKPLRVMPKDKRQPVHAVPLAHNAVVRVRLDAIEVGTIQGEGVAKYLGLLGALLLIFPLFFLFGAIKSVLAGFSYFLAIQFLLSSLIVFVLCLYMIRRGFLSPSDYPVQFNRKNRKVHVIPIKRLSFFKFWEKGAPGALRSYRWEDVQARTYRRLDVPGGTVARTETVMQMLCTTPEQPTKVDLMVDLGVTGTWRDATQVQLWEHVRRYMEEEGPPLNPGDTLRKTNYDKLPDFPPHVVAAAGGPALSEAELAKWTVKQT